MLHDLCLMADCGLCSLHKARRLHNEEDKLTPHSVIALRMLFGCITYLDDGTTASPLGDYAEFLSDLRTRPLIGKLTVEDVHAFLMKAAGVPKGQKHAMLILADEANAAAGSFAGEEVTAAALP